MGSAQSQTESTDRSLIVWTDPQNKSPEPEGNQVQQLHSPRSARALKKFLTEGAVVDLNAIECTRKKAPIHSIVSKHGKSSEERKLLETLLTYGDVDIDLKDSAGNTALHIAIENDDITSVKMLVAFGANLSAVNRDGKLTPTKLGKLTSTSCDSKQTQENKATTSPANTESKAEEEVKSKEVTENEMTRLLRSLGGASSRMPEQPLPGATLHPCNIPLPYNDNENQRSRQQYKEVTTFLNFRARAKSSVGSFESTNYAAGLQQKMLARFQNTGSRILCLDGGGMKGLIELDVMESIEQQTGKSITELFDWIVGTSTGGILALGLVYARKSIKELRQLCFRMKDEVFSNPTLGVVYDSGALEKILIGVLGEEMTMDEVKHPKVLVAATYKGSTPLKLHLFNNCFEDDYSNEVVWKVARSTCSGPILFSEFNNYVDGGVLCSNPTEEGVTAIQNYHEMKGEKLPISLIVSIGCGMYPASSKDLGNVDYMSNLYPRRLMHLIDLFCDALGKTEPVAKRCERNFGEQYIPYYRFSPRIDGLNIKAGETDSEKLIDMIIQARQQTLTDVIKMVNDKHLQHQLLAPLGQ